MDRFKRVGAIIKNRRRELSYSQSYIAEELGVSVSHISNIENGRREIGAYHFSKLSDILNVDLIDLYSVRFQSGDIEG